MDQFEPGDVVRVPHPDTGAQIEGTFIGMADAAEAIEVAAADGSTRKADTAWIELDDGTTRKIVGDEIRPVEGV